MTGYDIINLACINETDEGKVRALADSMVANGWQGCPILVYADSLLTGSHRLAALKLIRDEYEDDSILGEDVAEDVTGIVEENIAAYEEKHGWAPDIDYGNIGWLLKDSWVEEYKDEIAEW